MVCDYENRFAKFWMTKLIQLFWEKTGDILKIKEMYADAWITHSYHSQDMYADA